MKPKKRLTLAQAASPVTAKEAMALVTVLEHKDIGEAYGRIMKIGSADLIQKLIAKLRKYSSPVFISK